MTYVPDAQDAILGGGSLSISFTGSQAHPGLIQLGQKAMRKNCASVDAFPAHSGCLETLPVNTRTEIANMIAIQDQQLVLQTYTSQRYLILRNALVGICPPDNSGLTGMDFKKIYATAKVAPFENNPLALFDYTRATLNLYAATLGSVSAAVNSMPVPPAPPP
jgi:hypothetical protein